MTPYGCVCTGPEVGMIEVVLNAETVSSIQVAHGGSSAAFKDTPIVDWIRKHNPNGTFFHFTHKKKDEMLTTTKKKKRETSIKQWIILQPVVQGIVLRRTCWALAIVTMIILWSPKAANYSVLFSFGFLTFSYKTHSFFDFYGSRY